jgi:hypothetical protein
MDTDVPVSESNSEEAAAPGKLGRPAAPNNINVCSQPHQAAEATERHGPTKLRVP